MDEHVSREKYNSCGLFFFFFFFLPIQCIGRIITNGGGRSGKSGSCSQRINTVPCVREICSVFFFYTELHASNRVLHVENRHVTLTFRETIATDRTQLFSDRG